MRWQFNETTGVIAPDTSGNGRHGDVNDTTEPNWVDDAERDWCLDFNDGDFVLDNDANTYMNGLRGLTVALWIKSDVNNTDSGFIIFEEPSGGDDRNIRYDSDGSGGGGTNLIKYGVTTGEGNEADESSSEVQTTAWQHIAVTWRGGVRLKLYIDGVLDIPSDDDNARTGTTTGYDRVMVGKGGKDEGAGEGWNGLIDDVQIYNYALSAAEIITVRDGSTTNKAGVYYPVDSPADLFEDEEPGSRYVNFKDYARLADEWLEYQPFP